MIAFIIANALSGENALLQVSFWALAFLIVLVPFDALRAYASVTPPPTFIPEGLGG